MDMRTFIHQAAIALQEEMQASAPKKRPNNKIEFITTEDGPEMQRIYEASQRLKKLMKKKLASR